MPRTDTMRRVGSWELDLASRSGWWSPGMYAVTGRDPSLGPPGLDEFWTLVHPDDLAQVRADFARCLEEAVSVESRFRSNPASGIERQYRSTVHAIPNSEGTTVRMAGTTEDITDLEPPGPAGARRLRELTALHSAAMAVIQAGDADELIDRVTETIGRSLYPDHFGMLLVDPDRRLLIPHPSYRGIDPGIWPPEIDWREGIAGKVAQTGQAVRVGDVRRVPEFIRVTGESRSELCVPIKIDNRVLGVINAESSQLDFFTEEDEQLLITIAGQIASAMENLRLTEVENQRIRELESLYENSVALRGLLDPEEIGGRFIEILKSRLDWHHAVVRLKDPDSDRLHVIVYNEPDLDRSTLGPKLDTMDRKIARVGQGMTGWVAGTGQTARSGDLPSDPRYVETFPGIRSGLYAPLMVGTEVIGAVGVESELPDAFSQHDERLLATLSNQVAAALHNAVMFAQTRRNFRRTQALRAIDRAIVRLGSLEEVAGIVLDQIRDELEYHAAMILLYDERADRLEYRDGIGIRVESLEHRSLELAHTLAARVVRRRAPVHIPDLAGQLDRIQNARFFRAEGFVSYFAVPMIARSQVLGVLEVFHRQIRPMEDETVEFLESLAGQLAIAVDNLGLLSNLQASKTELERAYDATIAGWARALDLRDHETVGHARRVTEMTVALARRLGLGEAEIIHIQRGSLLHDIGKMGIPDSILHKPGPLDGSEWAVMKGHPGLANEMLSPIEYLRPALDIPYCHHEKWDGTGYPQGLRGEEIPIAARVFALVDVWDALRSDRPYRRAWTEAEALDYIRAQAGYHFDPAIVELFLQLREESEAQPGMPAQPGAEAGLG